MYLWHSRTTQAAGSRLFPQRMDSVPSDFIPKRKPAPGSENQADIELFKGVERPAYRLPLGIPSREGKGLGGKATAIGIHLLLILLILAPLTSPELRKEILGAGGPGPAGGGGGGNRGTGGGSHRAERTQFVQVVPPPPPKPTTVPQITPPVVKPPVVVPPPVVTPPVVKPTEVKPEVKNDAALNDKPPADAASVTAGTGGGRGTDGGIGNGTGSGGGVGSGVGTGRGSGVGAGTGGGAGDIYPPTPTELFIPPMPPPSRIKGFELIAEFDVDSTGKVIDFKFTETKDGAYNKKLKDVLGSVRFRPGTNGLGYAVRAKTQIIYTF